MATPPQTSATPIEDAPRRSLPIEMGQFADSLKRFPVDTSIDYLDTTLEAVTNYNNTLKTTLKLLSDNNASFHKQSLHSLNALKTQSSNFVFHPDDFLKLPHVKNVSFNKNLQCFDIITEEITDYYRTYFDPDRDDSEDNDDESYISNIPLADLHENVYDKKFTIPSYTIRYEFTAPDNFHKLVDLTAELASPLHSHLFKRLAFSIFLTDPIIRAHNCFFDTFIDLSHFIHSYGVVALPGRHFNPYIDSTFDHHYTIDDFKNPRLRRKATVQPWSSDRICFGSDSADIDNFLRSSNMFFHTKAILNTLFTPDSIGHGFSPWTAVFSRFASIAKSIKNRPLSHKLFGPGINTYSKILYNRKNRRDDLSIETVETLFLPVDFKIHSPTNNFKCTIKLKENSLKSLHADFSDKFNNRSAFTRADQLRPLYITKSSSDVTPNLVHILASSTSRHYPPIIFSLSFDDITCIIINGKKHKISTFDKFF